MRTKKPQIPQPKEHDVQAAIVKVLQTRGHLVYETTAYRQKGESGVDKGIPDLLVLQKPHRSNGYDAGKLVGLEVKRPGKIRWSSYEQELAWIDNAFVVVQSVPAAVYWVEFEFQAPSERKLPDELHVADWQFPTHEERVKRRNELLHLIEKEKWYKRSSRRGGG